ncbi:LexA repressor [Serratia sp. M24T3]|uniref:LexA family protein n=1 Tax=Serratia sp. M24T3 TaxID=932213 RepID=UPI00025BB649|nr:LexA repressor [Serratia sp. M24T3]EIC83334.1 LexA repressor [Serratia sp. M24T3]
MRKQLSPITPKQREVLEFLKSFLAENGFPPTRGEIAEHFGFKSPNAADENLRSLVKKGFIKLSAGKFRGITIISHHIEQPRAAVPLAHAEWQSQVVEASRKWVKCKGRYHSEQNMAALIELFSQEPECEA